MPTETEYAGEVGADDVVVPENANRDHVTGMDVLELGPQARKAGFGQRVWKSTWPKLAAIVIALLIWQVAVWSGWRPSYVFPGPVATFKELGPMLATGDFWQAFAVTMIRALVGFAVAVILGTLLGAAVTRFAVLRAAVGSLITGLQTMPSIMWFPLAILLFQLSQGAILFVVIIGATPSIANGLISGIDYIPRTWLRVGQVLGLKGLDKYRYLILPAALPTYVSGLKQGWAFSWRSLMAGELLVTVPGVASLGTNMENAREFGDSKSVISYIIVVLVIGIIINSVFNAGDNTLRKRWGLTQS